MIDRLENEIRQYRIEFQRFLNGELAIPPEEIETKLRKRINEIVALPQMSSVDRFRLSGLENRFNSLNELFRRRQRAQLAQPQGTSPSSPPRATSVDLGPGSEAGDVEALYDAIYSERASDVDLGSFHAYLTRQAKELRERTGCAAVRFTVHSEDGKPKLKARGVKPPQGEPGDGSAR